MEIKPEINHVIQYKLLQDFEEKWKLMAPSYVAQRKCIPCDVDPTTEAYMKKIAWALYLDGANKGLEMARAVVGC